MSIKRKVDGEWREVGLRYRKVDGQWRQVVKSYRKVNGEWKLVYQRAIHQPYLYGLENFVGTYSVVRRADGTFHVEIDGRALPSKTVQIGVEIPIPNSGDVHCTIASYNKSIYQENNLAIMDAGQERYVFPDALENEPVYVWDVNKYIRIFINLRTAYDAVQAHFTITDFKIDGVPM